MNRRWLGWGLVAVAVAAVLSAIVPLRTATGQFVPVGSIIMGRYTTTDPAQADPSVGSLRMTKAGFLSPDGLTLSETICSTSTADAQCIALVAGKSIKVYGLTFSVGATATTGGLMYGTGTDCATGPTNFYLWNGTIRAANTNTEVNTSPHFISTGSGKAVCWDAGTGAAGSNGRVVIRYRQEAE